MTDNGFHYQILAKQFIDSWQRQLSGMMMNESFVKQLIDAMQMPFSPGAMSYAAQPSEPSVPPDTAGDAVGKLECRLAASEMRIAELERELAELRRAVSVPA